MSKCQWYEHEKVSCHIVRIPERRGRAHISPRARRLEWCACEYIIAEYSFHDRYQSYDTSWAKDYGTESILLLLRYERDQVSDPDESDRDEDAVLFFSDPKEEISDIFVWEDRISYEPKDDEWNPDDERLFREECLSKAHLESGYECEYEEYRHFHTFEISYSIFYNKTLSESSKKMREYERDDREEGDERVHDCYLWCP